MDSISDNVLRFPDEIRHLGEIEEKLDLAMKEAEEHVLRLDAEYREAKQYMADSFSEMDSHERLQNERLLQQTDRSGALAVKIREKTEKLKDSPYFARIDFLPDAGDEESAIYIGGSGFEYDGDQLIFDWRAPVSGMFYDYCTGHAGFDAPAGRIEGELTRRRQFKIRNGMMEYVLESAEHIRDDVLQKELAGTSDERMKSIISTIQREQNDIIRNEYADTMIIQGVAGSGKTSVALHRIAFLMYRFRDSIRAEDILIVSPNKVFGDYISGVIPELGEEPVCEAGMPEIAEKIIKNKISFEMPGNYPEGPDEKQKIRAQFKSTLGFVQMMDEYISDMPERVFKPVDFNFEGVTVPAVWIGEKFAEYSTVPVKKRLGPVAEDIRRRLDSQLPPWREPPKSNAVLRELNKMLAIKSGIMLYRDFYKTAGFEKMFVMPEKNMLEWDDVFPFIYLMAAFEGIDSDTDVKHMVIDEMQDYTPVQYEVLNMVYPCRKTILGDFGQMINPCHVHTLNDMKTIYEGAEFAELNRSYRSTYEIMSYANAVCRQPRIEMIERHGSKPQKKGFESKIDEVRYIEKRIGEFEESESGSMGIILKSEKDAEKLFDIISQRHDVNFVCKDSASYSGGVNILGVQMAKGLEFDEVLVPGANRDRYNTEHDRNVLYVAFTRAMHRLTVTYSGEPSQFLPDC